jgi:hypothetical protein
MTDIVERLRNWPEQNDWHGERICTEAADEIERLREEGQRDYDDMREFKQKFIDATHEIEWLDKVVDRWQGDAECLGHSLTERDAEIERLRERCAANDTSLKWYDETLGERDAEIDLLRTALLVHRYTVWGDGPVGHPADAKLYEALNEQPQPNLD